MVVDKGGRFLSPLTRQKNKIAKTCFMKSLK